MAEIAGLDLGVDVPGFVSGSATGNIITIILTIVVLMFALIIGWYIWKQNKVFNKKIVDFENIAGQGYQPVFKDRARLVRVGDGGEEILYLKKKKQYRTAYGKKMGKNTYWFSKGQDGYFYNTLLGDLDAKMGMLDIEPVDRDMRYMHVAIRKNIQERYRKIGFMEKYGTILINGIFLIIMGAMLWFMVDQIGELMAQATKVVESVKPLIDTMQQALGNVDAVCSGGSGIATV